MLVMKHVGSGHGLVVKVLNYRAVGSISKSVHMIFYLCAKCGAFLTKCTIGLRAKLPHYKSIIILNRCDVERPSNVKCH